MEYTSVVIFNMRRAPFATVISLQLTRCRTGKSIEWPSGIRPRYLEGIQAQYYVELWCYITSNEGASQLHLVSPNYAFATYYKNCTQLEFFYYLILIKSNKEIVRNDQIVLAITMLIKGRSYIKGNLRYFKYNYCPTFIIIQIFHYN